MANQAEYAAAARVAFAVKRALSTCTLLNDNDRSIVAMVALYVGWEFDLHRAADLNRFLLACGFAQDEIEKSVGSKAKEAEPCQSQSQKRSRRRR